MRPFVFALVFAALTLAACAKPAEPPGTAESAKPAEPPGTTESAKPAVPAGTPGRPAAIAHGGVGSPPSRVDGCRKAVDAALRVLEDGGKPLDAAIAGVVVLEDDPRFNAGTGSRVRLDGRTVQMDAAVMTSAGDFGAVAVIENVKNPVRVARAVIDTPHNLVAGDGAVRLARALGFPPYDPATDEMREKTRKIVAQLKARDPKVEDAWRGFDWRKHWNFEATLEELGFDPGHDTVGVAVRGGDGSYAAALSTGGTAITLRGRVGDVPIHGAGLYAGAHGAVAATGKGERIVEASLSRRVHDRLGAKDTVDQAARFGVEEIKGRGSIGLIVIDEGAMTAAADRKMAWAARELGSSEWLGPTPE